MRVLNLWQKNGVFKIDVIQPLLDMAAASDSGAASFINTDEPGNLYDCEHCTAIYSFLIIYKHNCIGK